MKGNQYLHLVKAIQGDRYQIGNNRRPAARGGVATHHALLRRRWLLVALEILAGAARTTSPALERVGRATRQRPTSRGDAVVHIVGPRWQNGLVASDARTFSKADLEEALRAIASTITKCEKVQPKLKQGTSQHTLLARRIKALYIASTLIQRELDSGSG